MKNANFEVIREIVTSNSLNVTLDEIRTALQAIEDGGEDFYLDLDGEEYRVIHEDAVERIWEESLKELLEDCYEIPEHLEEYIDYDRWVEDCKMYGMGHHFSSYDGSELDANGYYIFRIN